MSKDTMAYKAPPLPPAMPTIRKVFVLPADLVRRIHNYGYQNGHQSEVSAARELLEQALSAWEMKDARDGL